MIRKYYIVFVSLLLLIAAIPLKAFAMESVTAEIPFIIDSTPGTVVIEAVGDEPLPAVTVVSDVLLGEFEIAYTEPGNYYYHVYQNPGDKQEYLYDESIYNVLVSVFTDEYEKLYAVVTLGIDGNPEKPEMVEFANIIDPLWPGYHDPSDDRPDDWQDATQTTTTTTGDVSPDNAGNTTGSSNGSVSGSSGTADGGIPPKLPQTGQLWWPVPVMIGFGILLILLGIMTSRKSREDSEP